jgi:curved DNA-binding protein CbpA
MPRPNNHLYDLLETGPEATPRGLKHNHRRITKRLREKAARGDEAATDRLEEVEYAFSILADHAARQLYDRYGEAAFEPGFELPQEDVPTTVPAQRTAAPHAPPPMPHAAAPPPTARPQADRWWVPGNGAAEDEPTEPGATPRSAAPRPPWDRPPTDTRPPPRGRKAAFGPDAEPEPDPDMIDVEYELVELEPEPEVVEPVEIVDDTVPETLDAAEEEADQAEPSDEADADGWLGQEGTARARVVDGKLEVQLPFMLAALGGDAQIYIGEEPFALHVNPGTADGTEVEVDDVPIVYRVADHPTFKLHGPHLVVPLHLELGQVLRRVEVTVPTLTGAARFRVPRQARTGHVLRLQGLGCERPEGEPGHLLVALEVDGEGKPRVQSFGLGNQKR